MDNMVFLYGLAGGLLPDAIRIINNRYNPQLPEYMKSVNFYVGIVLLVLLGGGAAYLLKADSVVDALAMGYSAPQIVSSFLSQKANQIAPPQIPADGGDVNARGGGLLETPAVPGGTGEPTLRSWWGM